MLSFQDFLDKNPDAYYKADAGEWRAHCPACGASGALAIYRTEAGEAGYRCLNGCKRGAVAAALKIRAGDLKASKRKAAAACAVADYVYRYESGAPAYKVTLTESGTRTLSVLIANKWQWGFTRYHAQEIPYRLPELRKARPGELVLVAPSEQDADALASIGAVATSYISPAASGKFGGWRDEFCKWIPAGRKVVVIPRVDPPPAKKTVEAALAAYAGQREAKGIVDSLLAAGFRARVVELPSRGGVPVKRPAEWVAAGGNLDELAMAIKAAPPWKCPDALDEVDPALVQQALDKAAKAPRASAKAVSAAGAAVGPGAAPGARAYDSSVAAKLGPPPASVPDSFPGAPSLSPLSKNDVGGGGKNSELANGGRAVAEGDDEDENAIAWIRKRIVQILIDGKTSQFVKRREMAEEIVLWLKRRGRFYYDERYRDFRTAMFFDRATLTLFFIESDWFQSWIARVTAINRDCRDFSFALKAIEDEAVSDEATGTSPHSYFARVKGKIYISNGDSKMCRLSPGVAEMVENGTDGVLFLRGKTLSPWSYRPGEEKDPFKECRVFRDCYGSEQGKFLIELWAASVFSCCPRKPPLLLTGKPGCGKTTVAWCIAELVGLLPASANVARDQKSEEGFWTLVDNGGIVTLDNVDERVSWFGPAIETYSTGGVNPKKRLYTDSDLFYQHSNSWIIITSARPMFASSRALSSRVLAVDISAPDNVTPRENLESALVDEIHAGRDGFMTFFVTALKKVLADNGPVPKQINERHPDFGAFAYRIGRAFGRADYAKEVLLGAERDKNLLNIKNSWIGELLLQAIRQHFEGTATDILALFGTVIEGFDPTVDPVDTKRNGKVTPVKIGKRILEIWDSLVGAMNAKRVNHNGVTVWKFDPITPHNVGGEVPFLESAHTEKKEQDKSQNTHLTPHIVGGDDMTPEELADLDFDGGDNE